MNSVVTRANNNVRLTFAKKVNLKCSLPKNKMVAMENDGYVNLIVVIISQYIHILKHHTVHLKYMLFLFVKNK